MHFGKAVADEDRDEGLEFDLLEHDEQKAVWAWLVQQFEAVLSACKESGKGYTSQIPQHCLIQAENARTSNELLPMALRFKGYSVTPTEQDQNGEYVTAKTIANWTRGFYESNAGVEFGNSDVTEDMKIDYSMKRVNLKMDSLQAEYDHKSGNKRFKLYQFTIS